MYSPSGGRLGSDHCLVLDGIFWIATTYAPCRDLPNHFGKLSSAYRKLRRWPLSGLWDTMLEVLNTTGLGHQSVQMVDNTVIRTHQHGAAGKGGLKSNVLAVPALACRQKSI